LNWAQYSEASKSGTEFSVFVGDLSADVTETQLQKSFMENFHSVQSVRIVMDPATGISKGYGFVRFGSEDEGREALISMQGVFIGSRPIRVSLATPKKQQAFNPFEDDELEIPSSSTTPTTTTNDSSPYSPYYYGNYPYSSEYYPYNYNYTNPISPDSDTTMATSVQPTIVPTVRAAVTDLNLFTRCHDVAADNNNFVTRCLGSVNEEATCGNRAIYNLSTVDATPYQ